MGTPISSDDITPPPCSDAASGSSTPRLSLVALAKREAARRGLYSRFFRGPVLGPDVQSETVEAEATPVSQSLVGDNARVGMEKRSKKKSKAAKKLHRRNGKERGENGQDADETIPLSAPQEQVSALLAFETPHEVLYKRKKKNRRREVSSTGELDTPPFERTLVVEDCEDSKKNDSSKASRKRRRRNESL